jgi:hypothetical protein
MDFQCPHCANRLSIPDQYAGTMMKCPICSKTFQAPSLPAQLPPNVPPAPPPAPGGGEGYKIAPEAPRSTPPPPPPPPPAIQTKAPAPPPPPPSGPTDYTGAVAAALDTRVVPWIAPACLLLVFVLLWFPWVGQYQASIPVNIQTGWGTMLGSSTVHELWAHSNEYTAPTDFSLMNGLMLLFFLALLLALPLSIAAAVLPMVQVSLPPQVEQFKHFRWALVAIVILGAFLLLTLQLVMHFSIETQVRDRIAKDFQGKLEGDQMTADKLKYAADITKAGLQRTSYLRLAWYLCVLAVLAALLQFWLDRRGPAAPPPRFDLRW